MKLGVFEIVDLTLKLADTYDARNPLLNAYIKYVRLANTTNRLFIVCRKNKCNELFYSN